MSRLAWDYGIKALTNSITCVIIAGGNDGKKDRGQKFGGRGQGTEWGAGDDRKYSNNLTAGVF